MKLLVIWRLLTVGGVNAGWRNRAAYFKKFGIQTDFLYNKDLGGRHVMEDVSTVYLTSDESEIISIIQQNQYDAIIVVDTGAAYRWIRKSGYQGPIIVEARTPELKKLRPHVQTFEGVRPAVMVTPSEYERRLASIYVDNVPIHVIYNGVDTSFFRPLSSDEIDLSTEPNLPEQKKVIGWIGRLDKRKDWRMLLRVARLIHRERADVEFWVIGGAKSLERKEFARQYKRGTLTQFVKWFPVISYQEMPQIYAKIRRTGGCTLATTKAESFGNTFIESMACGVPVVAPKISSIPEVVADGETGFWYRERHVRGATKQIHRLLDDPGVYSRMSATAIQHVENRFSIPITGDRYIHLLWSIVQQHQTNRGNTDD